MSISWSRLIPAGVKGSPLNPEGVKFYNSVFDELHKNGIEPAVTLYHWDMPQVTAGAGQALSCSNSSDSRLRNKAKGNQQGSQRLMGVTAKKPGILYKKTYSSCGIGGSSLLQLLAADAAPCLLGKRACNKPAKRACCSTQPSFHS